MFTLVFTKLAMTKMLHSEKRAKIKKGSRVTIYMVYRATDPIASATVMRYMHIQKYNRRAVKR